MRTRRAPDRSRERTMPVRRPSRRAPLRARARRDPRDRTQGEAFLEGLRRPTRFLDLDALIATSDLVVEASTQAHLEDIAPKTLGAGKDLVVLSCGALLRHKDWIDLAEAKRCRIYVPSGAICGLDGVKGARAGAVSGVTLEMRKPP